MNISEFYKVTVNVEVDTGITKKNGDPKIEKHKEVYLVTNCGSMSEAEARVRKEFKDSMDEFFPCVIKTEKIDAILDAKN